jgi:integrase
MSKKHSDENQDQPQQPQDKTPAPKGSRKKRASKRTRRRHGEGTVTLRKDGRWQADISLGTDETTGKRKRLTRYGRTEEEAYAKLHKALQELGRGTLIAGPQETLKQYLEYWLEEVHKTSIKPSTYGLYRRNLNRHIIPGLGYIQLQKLTPAHVQAFYAKKQKEGLSPRFIGLLHAILSTALKDAVQWELIAKNVCVNVKLPRKEQHEIPILTKEQAQKLITVAHKRHMATIIALALTTGMRRGELLGLYWDNIDFETRSLQVTQALSYIAVEGGYGGYQFVESTPKTASSRRRIMLPQFVIDMLKKRKEQQQKLTLQAGEIWKEHTLVFTSQTGGYLAPHTLHQKFKRILQEAELPDMRIHDLRHNAATLLLSMGVNPKVVQEILGHANISMTLNIYSHVLPSMQQEAMDQMDKEFGKGSKEEKGGDDNKEGKNNGNDEWSDGEIWW